MSIGQDIASVLQELGTVTRIHKFDGTIIEDEYVDTEAFTESSAEWKRQHFVTVSFPYTTQVETSDIIEFNNEFYIVTSKDPALFENAPVEYLCACLRCNCFGTFERFNESPGYDAEYEPLSPFSLLIDNVRAAFIETSASTKYLLTGGVSGDDFVSAELYISPYTDLEIGDRWFPDRTNRTEYYEVKLIQKYRLAGTYVCLLKEDRR